MLGGAEHRTPGRGRHPPDLAPESRRGRHSGRAASRRWNAGRHRPAAVFAGIQRQCAAKMCIRDRVIGVVLGVIGPAAFMHRVSEVKIKVISAAVGQLLVKNTGHILIAFQQPAGQFAGKVIAGAGIDVYKRQGKDGF